MPKLRDRVVRRVVESVPVISHNNVLMTIFDAVDRTVSLPFREFRSLPPNRMRIRVGVGNRVLFNQAYYLEYGAQTVIELMSEHLLDRDSSLVDIGCGCGRLAEALYRSGFSGRYSGIDVDSEMIEWCVGRFAGDKFRFYHANTYSKIYNPQGQKSPYRVPLEDASQDLVVAQSLLTHLLADDLANYMSEARRVLREGRSTYMGVFCLEDIEQFGLLGGRWRFPGTIGAARVESVRFPEAAVAYERGYLEETARAAGFTEVAVVPRAPQSILRCRR